MVSREVYILIPRNGGGGGGGDVCGCGCGGGGGGGGSCHPVLGFYNQPN